MATLSETRTQMRPQTWPIERFHVNGLAIERWCLKTLITIAFGGEFAIGNRDSRPGEPSRALVETAFGLRQFQPPRAGLHWMGDAGEVVNVQEGVIVTTFSGRAQRLEGARFWFWGLNLLLILNDGPTGPFSFTSPDGMKTVQPKTWYRPGAINISAHDRLSHRLEFSWSI